VVADEVRALAERTTRATREIAEMIKTIQTETGQAVSAMQRSAEEVESGARGAEESGEALMRITGQLDEITIEISQIATATQQQSLSTNEVAESVTGISTLAASFLESTASMTEKLERLVAVSEEMKKTAEAFTIPNNELLMLNTAKSDHLAFVGRIERCLDGTEQIQADKLPDHTCCRFGKWYFGEGKELCGSAPSFKSINPPHEEFHRAAREAVLLHGRGNDGEAFHLLEQAQRLSGRIVELLDKVHTESCSIRTT
jgi:methyl-accepting chemotaxis protein